MRDLKMCFLLEYKVLFKVENESFGYYESGEGNM